jgi:hypothetical protein
MQHFLTDFYMYWFLEVSTFSNSSAVILFLNTPPTTAYIAAIQAQQIFVGT